MSRPTPITLRKRRGFTLVELLLSMTVLSILMLVIVQVTSQTSNVWRNTTAKADQFREARDAFESITRNLSQATLNTYYDYFNAAGQRRTQANAATFIPAKYGRYSELKFQVGATSTLLGSSADRQPGHAVFFQAPLGFSNENTNTALNSLLNTWGYFVDFRPDTDRPSFVPGSTRYRFRLVEYMQPTEQLKIFDDPAKWLDDAKVANSPRTHVLASNIIALFILPKLPAKGPANDPTVDPTGAKLAPKYDYDSTTTGSAATNGAEYNSLNQLPPLVEVTMVAIDEASAMKLERQYGNSPPNFGLSAMFKDASPTKREHDLEALSGYLTAHGISFRVFSTEVSLRGAKWSREQTAN